MQYYTSEHYHNTVRQSPRTDDEGKKGRRKKELRNRSGKREALERRRQAGRRQTPQLLWLLMLMLPVPVQPRGEMLAEKAERESGRLQTIYQSSFCCFL